MRPRVEAKVKLDAIRNKIGYPEKWRDYSALIVEAGRSTRQRGAQCGVRAQAQLRQDGQAGRREGVGHDTAYRQRVLQPTE